MIKPYLRDMINDHKMQGKVSSNINEVIRPVLNFLFFFYDKISQALKSTKKH